MNLVVSKQIKSVKNADDCCDDDETMATFKAQFRILGISKSPYHFLAIIVVHQK